MRSLQKMQTLRLPFFCQAFSSLSRLGRLLPPPPFALPGIQWCLLLDRRTSHRRGDRRAPIAAAVAGRRRGGAAGLLHAGGGPFQAGAEVVGLDLDDRPPLSVLVLPRALLEPAGDDNTSAPRERLGRVF